MKGKLYYKAIKFENNWENPVSNVESKKEISVIIPVYHPYHLDAVVSHLSKMRKIKEIILVDDSGEFQVVKYVLMKQFSNVKVFYHEINLGRSAARNTGAAKATGEILVFMDQDMFLCPDFMEDVKRYFQVNDSIIYLGLRDTISSEQIPDYSDWTSPNANHDWRVNTYVSSDFIDLTISGIGNADNHCHPGKVISIFEQSNHLKKLGVNPDLTIGYWDLPSMVISHSMAISKKDFFDIGGFPEWISGWGGEDIVVGFLACAKYISIYLSNSVSYQAEHAPYSGSQKAKLLELKNNIDMYKNWASRIDDFPVFEYEQINKRGLVGI